ncbi:hypothetical protein KXW43_007843, partial [Aspergillus fumigatus]
KILSGMILLSRLTLIMVVVVMMMMMMMSPLLPLMMHPAKQRTDTGGSIPRCIRGYTPGLLIRMSKTDKWLVLNYTRCFSMTGCSMSQSVHHSMCLTSELAPAVGQLHVLMHTLRR